MVSYSEVLAALQDVARTGKALDAIRECPARDPQHGLQCLRIEDHAEMVGTRHRARRLYGDPVQVEWLEW